MLRGQEKHKGAATPLHDERTLPKLKDLGISKIQSHRWQQAATVLGETLREQERKQVQRDETFDDQRFEIPKLKELGISETQSHNMQYDELKRELEGESKAGGDRQSIRYTAANG